MNFCSEIECSIKICSLRWKIFVYALGLVYNNNDAFFSSSVI